MIQSIEINYKRLRRQYDINVAQFDLPALLDLSHILRIWVEMKNEIEIHLPLEQNIFKSYSLSGPLKQLLWNKNYIIAFFPNNVTTYAGNGEIFSSDDDLSQMKLSLGARFKPEEKNGLTYQSFTVLFDILDELGRQNLNKYSINKTNYSGFLSSEAVKISFASENLPAKSISREILIKRVANILGGSHFESSLNTDNSYDPYIRKLMRFHIAGLPVPYLILLYTAKEIIENVKINSV